MTTSKLDAIEQRQIRMENDIKALIEQVGTLIARGADQADARFPSVQSQPIGYVARIGISTARA